MATKKAKKPPGFGKFDSLARKNLSDLLAGGEAFVMDDIRRDEAKRAANRKEK